MLEEARFRNRLCDLDGPVGRERIDEQNLVGPENALEALLNVDLLVERGDDRGDRVAFLRRSGDRAQSTLT